MRCWLVLAAGMLGSAGCGVAGFSATTEASQAERQLSGCYAIGYRALNTMARRERGLDAWTDTLLLAEDLLLPPIESFSHKPYGQAGRLLLRSLDDTVRIARGDDHRFWRFEGGVLELGWSGALGSSVARLRPQGTGYVGLDSVRTDYIIDGEPQPVFAVAAQRVGCPARLTPAT